MPDEATHPIDIPALNEDSPFHRLLGLTVTQVRPGEVEVVMPYADRLLANTTSPYIHGGAIATLIDVAGNFAIIAAIGRDVPTIDLRVDYLRPVRTGALRAVGRAVTVGRRLGVADVEVVDEVSAYLGNLKMTRGRVATVGFDRIPHPMFVGLTTRLPGIDFVDVTASVERARRIKSTYEIAQLRRAVEITEIGVNAVREAMHPGLSEVELAALADYAMKAAGATVLAFPTLVLSGPERVVPVGMPTERRVREGDVVMLDLGATWNGYQADLSRTFVVGRPSPDQERAYQVVLNAWQRTMDETRPGARCRRLQEVAAQAAAEAGYTLAHRVGHGVGLATSLEWPNIQNEEEPLA